MKLIITPEVYSNVMYWVKKANFEVSGLGMVQVINGQAYVTKAILLDQVGSGASTDIDPEDINRAQYEMRREEGDLKWWWHSHVDMGVFWSPTDKATIKQLGDQGWFFHTVFNRKSERKSAFSTTQTVDCPFYPERYSYTEEEIESEIGTIAAQDTTELDRLFDLKVKRHTPQNYYDGKIWNQSTQKWEEPQIGLIKPTNKQERKHTRKALEDLVPGFSDYNSRADFEAMLEELIAQGVDMEVIREAYQHDIKRLGVSLSQIRSDFMAAEADARLAHGTVS